MPSTDSVFPDAGEPAVTPEVSSSPSVQADSAQHTAPAIAALSPAACAEQLKQLFPALFAGAPKPLKLRIHVDIQERASGRFSKQALTAFFRRYTGSTSYLLAIVRGRARFDLDGKPAGEVTDENRQAASDELDRRGVQRQSRREIEEQQRRNRAGLLFDYERTTLTRANFCVLKGVANDELDGLLAIAREEAAQMRTSAHRQPASHGQRAGEPRPSDAQPGTPRNANRGRPAR